MLKQRPKQFWGMLKSKATRDLAMPTADFVKFNESGFFYSTIATDKFTPLSNTAPQYITKEELTSVIALHLKADKSTGLSQMPLHLLKHMGPAGIECLAALFNSSAIDQLPPTLWRTSKITPLYKGKGDMTLPENYRSIAVAPPLSKLFMAVMNRRLTDHAKADKLHAPTQAGFREYQSTIEQALILQTLL
jgi:hypothetical protein